VGWGKVSRDTLSRNTVTLLLKTKDKQAYLLNFFIASNRIKIINLMINNLN